MTVARIWNFVWFPIGCQKCAVLKLITRVPECAPDKADPKFELHNHNSVRTYLSIRSSKNITRFLDGVYISIHFFGKILNDIPEQVPAILLGSMH